MRSIPPAVGKSRLSALGKSLKEMERQLRNVEKQLTKHLLDAHVRNPGFDLNNLAFGRLIVDEGARVAVAYNKGFPSWQILQHRAFIGLSFRSDRVTLKAVLVEGSNHDLS